MTVKTAISRKKKITKNRTTSYLPWGTAQLLIKSLIADQKYNTALMLAGGIYFGLRIGDLLKLTWEQIESPAFEIHEIKTNKRRIVTVHPEFAKIRDKIKSLLPYYKQPSPKDFVFTSQEPRGSKYPISVQAANKRFKKALRTYQVDTANPSSHTLRKTFARRLWETNGKNEASLILLSRVLNHRSISVTRIYIGITDEEINNAYLML